MRQVCCFLSTPFLICICSACGLVVTDSESTEYSEVHSPGLPGLFRKLSIIIRGHSINGTDTMHCIDAKDWLRTVLSRSIGPGKSEQSNPLELLK
jgi:hypothetical protein